jgi:hypothetical protein
VNLGKTALKKAEKDSLEGAIETTGDESRILATATLSSGNFAHKTKTPAMHEMGLITMPRPSSCTSSTWPSQSIWATAQDKGQHLETSAAATSRWAILSRPSRDMRNAWRLQMKRVMSQVRGEHTGRSAIAMTRSGSTTRQSGCKNNAWPFWIRMKKAY